MKGLVIMTKYNYFESVKDDVREIAEEYKSVSEFATLEDYQQYLYDELFVDDSVTGNASGSYYCNSYRAKEALEGNLELLRDAYNEFGEEAETIANDFLNEEWEKMDVTIRCYVLGCVIWEITEEIWNNFEKENN